MRFVTLLIMAAMLGGLVVAHSLHQPEGAAVADAGAGPDPGTFSRVQHEE